MEENAHLVDCDYRRDNDSDWHRIACQDYLNMRYTQWVRQFEQCCDEEEIVPQRPTEPAQKPTKPAQKPSTR
jgi:hypothetical protein